MNAKEHYMDDKKNKQIINDGDTKVVAEKIKKQVNKNFGDVIYGDIIGLDEQAVSTILENRDAASRKEQIENARKNLDEAVHADNISSINVLAAVREVKKLLPEDFMANFYEVACGRTTKQLNKFLSNIYIEKNGKYVPEIADFLLKGMEYSSVLPLKTLVDIALRGSEKTDYLKKIEQEAENLKDGVYSIQVPRDVFVAYSSKDYKVANEIVEYLEDNKISCFVALRNLRHGKGAVENYADALKESMHNCKCVVFLSSNNSRSLECDALKQEIPYIRDHEPQMGRIEYLLEDYNEGTSAAAKRICESFFKNLEYCRYNKDDKSDLLNRVLKYITGFDDKRTESVTLENPQGKLKYCLACGAENPERSKFCIECGAKVFAADYQGYLNAKNEKYLSDLRAGLEAEYAQKYKKQQEELQKELGNRQKELEDLKKQNAEELEKQRNDLKKQNEELGKQREELKKQSEQLKSKSLQASSYPTLENYDTNEFEIKEGALKKYKGNKTKVLIPFGITSIGDNAFYYCTSLKEITIPDSVTSIGERAFWECCSLTEITIPDSVISIGRYAFENCYSLREITIPNSVTSIGQEAFLNCTNLKSITIGNGVTSIGDYAFHSCTSLTEITILTGVTSIGECAFQYCKSLTEITIPASVTSIGRSAFENCISLTEITIPNSVTSIDGRAFLGCKNLTIYCEAEKKPKTWKDNWNANCPVVWGYGKKPKQVVTKSAPVKEEKPKHVWKKYVRPPLDLLDDYPENDNVNSDEIEENKRVIVETFEKFKIESEVANVTVGPAITRYDVIIEDRTNIKRSLSYRDEIALALMKDNVTVYLNYSKGAISIEIPNNKRAIVGLKTMLASPQFINCKPNSLTFGLGKSVDGEVVCPNITKMPHLLVAGTTGSGKSICLNTLLVSLLYKYGPEELRLILVDPKQAEFIPFARLPHLMINEILYDVDKVIKALNWAIKEMERRYTLFKEMTENGVATRNLDEYNFNLPEGEEKLPKILIILDEFGDLMMQAKKDIEMRIIRLAQKARACGIHLILATQRPSVDCITGLIKSNLPSRIGFKVNSFDDSRTIFDVGGAEKLLGMGDMYFRSVEKPELTRIQGCYIDSKEVQKVTNFVRDNNETFFDEEATEFINKVEEPESSASAGGEDGEDSGEGKMDDTYLKALKYCILSNQASVSMIQRRFPVGYIKACKIIDWMDKMNYVTKSEGSKPRKVLMTMDEFTNTYGEVDD